MPTRKSAKQPARFIVEGKGHFPHDMLRYDVAAFADGKDFAAAGASDNSDWAEDDVRRKTRRVVLTRTEDSPSTAPCKDRWTSFGWTVIVDEEWDPARFEMLYHELRGKQAEAAPKAFSEFLGIHAVLQDTYDLTGIGTVLNAAGADRQYTQRVAPVVDDDDPAKVTGYELVRRLDLAHKRMRTLRLAIENTQAILDRGVLGTMS